jgi:hypothetical protein
VSTPPAFYHVSAATPLAWCGSCGQVLHDTQAAAHTADHAERARLAQRLHDLERLVDPLRCTYCHQPCHQEGGRWVADALALNSTAQAADPAWCPYGDDGHVVQP